MEAYIATAGPDVLIGDEIEDKWDKISDTDMDAARRSVCIEDLSEKQGVHNSELPPPDAKLNKTTKDPPQRASVQYLTFKLPEIEIMKSGELFNLHLLGQEEELDEPPNMQEEKHGIYQTESSESRSPSSTLRRSAPSEDPRKVYKSHELIEEPSWTEKKLGSDGLEVCRKEEAEQGISRVTHIPHSSYVERGLSNESSGTRRLSAPNLPKSKPIKKSTRFADENEVWNGVDRRSSLPWLSASKNDSGVGSDEGAMQEHTEFDRDSKPQERRGSGSWRLLGKRDKSEGVGMTDLESFSWNRKGNLGFWNIFKR